MNCFQPFLLSLTASRHYTNNYILFLFYFPLPNNTHTPFSKTKMQIQTLLLTGALALCADAAVIINRAASNSSSSAAAATGDADFGSCTPTIDFQLGRAEFNRKATEGTFFPTDATLVASTGQSDALNPNIITTFVCNQLTNVCGANDAAKTACASAKDVVAGLGTKDETTADAFNQALGF